MNQSLMNKIQAHTSMLKSRLYKLEDLKNEMNIFHFIIMYTTQFNNYKKRIAELQLVIRTYYRAKNPNWNTKFYIT